MGDPGEPQTENETTSDPKDLDSLNHDANMKGSPMPLLRVAVDNEGDDDSAHHHRPDNNMTAPHLRVAIHDDGDEEMSGEEHEESEEEENGEEHEEGEEDDKEENPMEEPVVEDANGLSSVRIVAHVTDGMADSDTGEQLAYPDEQYDEESEDEHEERYEDDHDEEENSDAQENSDTHEEDHDETYGEAHKEDNEEENIVDDGEEDKETRAMIHVQGYDKEEDLHEEQLTVLHKTEMDHPEYEMDHSEHETDEQDHEMNHQVHEMNHQGHEMDRQEHEMSQHEDNHTQTRSEEREIDQGAKVDELQGLISLSEEEEFEGDKMEDVLVLMNGALVEENVKEQPEIAVNGELAAHHDESEELQHARHSVVDQADASSSKLAEGIALEKAPIEKAVPEKKKPVTSHGKLGRPSSAPAARSDGSARAKRDIAEEGEGSDSTSRSKGGVAHTRPSVRGSRAKVTVPQPFHLATERRASMIGRPTDPDAPKPRTIVRKSQPVMKTQRPSSAGIRAAPIEIVSAGIRAAPIDIVSAGIRATPTEISKEDQEEKDRQAKLEEEIAALRIKVDNPSGFSFKSDERAEKRREFYSKLEEKMKAKEEEKSQHQAKSQEELENRMKLLRKTLTFKATPLPSFYQESAPPKAEVRKIPPTRPKSPKLTTSRRSTIVGDREGSRSPVARIRSELRGSALYKSVDSAYALKSNVRKSVSKIPSSTAARPKVNGSEPPRKAVPASVMPSPRKTLNVAESGMNRTPAQEKKALTPRGRSTNPRSPYNGGPAADRPKTAEIRSGNPVTKADGVRKSLQWRETAGSSARREAADAVKLGISTPTKRTLTPNVSGRVHIFVVKAVSPEIEQSYLITMPMASPKKLKNSDNSLLGTCMAVSA